jgi:hypothetical protein
MAVDTVLENGALEIKPNGDMNVMADNALYAESVGMLRRRRRTSVPVIMALIAGRAAAVNDDV